jgi:hypothetical protein
VNLFKPKFFDESDGFYYSETDGIYYDLDNPGTDKFHPFPGSYRPHLWALDLTPQEDMRPARFLP